MACLAGVTECERAGRPGRLAAEAPGHTPGSRSAGTFSSTSKFNSERRLSWNLVPAPACGQEEPATSGHRGLRGPWRVQQSRLPGLSCPLDVSRLSPVPSVYLS